MMLVTMVNVKVKEDFIQPFIDATRKNHLESIKEPGNCRFDILQMADDASHFILYEAYADESSAKAHKETAHYREWRDTVADWMEIPRQGVQFKALYPELSLA